MFTGIVQGMGTVERIERRGGDARLSLTTGSLSLARAAIGDSIAVNGVCLTAIDLEPNRFGADVSVETLGCTTLKRWCAGDRVNLEQALAIGDRLGGHIVSGHVDGVATVCARQSMARSVQFQLQAPTTLAKYIAAKGSVCLDGVSLTVNAVDGDRFAVNIVPHTLDVTTLSQWDVGTEVNLEVDLLARYLERLATGEAARGGITEALLARAGFLPRDA